MNEKTLGEVELYESHDGSISINVHADGDSVWLSRQQMATLFGRDIKTIGKHIASALVQELDATPVVAKFATTAADGKTYQVEHYSLDMVLSVGYRTKSVEGIHFRRWANEVLKKYLLQGAAINDRRLEEIGSIVRILSRSTDELVSGVADVLVDYLPGLQLLRDYDQGQIDVGPGVEPGWTLTTREARVVIAHVAAAFPQDTLFGIERGDVLDTVVTTIYQSFGGSELYATVEEKAATLIYLIVKDHPLSDGNKRSAAALFVTFLAHNGILSDANGHLKISNNALAAVTLMIAMSDPKEKDLMVALVVRMLGESTP